MVRRLCVYHKLQCQVVRQLGVVLHWQRSYSSEDRFHCLEVGQLLVFVYLAQDLVVVDHLGDHLLHANDQTTLSALGQEFTYDFVLF